MTALADLLAAAALWIALTAGTVLVAVQAAAWWWG
jgi:hypothetical protein